MTRGLRYWFQKKDKLGLKTYWPSGGPYLGFADQDLLAGVTAVLNRDRRCTL